jgi:O-acetyl-ADP-ribose deacetylase (regulator of RNase III)
MGPLPETVYLRDRTPELVLGWRQAFRDRAAVVVERGDYFGRPTDAMVSPANSFGIMDGGLDLAIRDALGMQVEARVRRMIRERHHGELPVGWAEVVETGDSRWPYLICAPTMRIPEDVSGTPNAYLAFRAVMLAIRRHNAAGAPRIASVVCSGLGTGVGRTPPRRCAAQMRVAYDQTTGPGRTPDPAAIYATHRKMLSAM